MPSQRRVRNFSRNGLLEFGLMKFNKCFLKISKEAEMRISRSGLFHSLTNEGKKVFLKKLCLTSKGVI